MLAVLVLVALIAVGIFYLWKGQSVDAEKQKQTPLITETKDKPAKESNIADEVQKVSRISDEAAKNAKSHVSSQEPAKGSREPKIGSLEPIKQTNGNTEQTPSSPKPKKNKYEPAIGAPASDPPTEFEKVAAAFRPAILSPQRRKFRKKSSSTDSNETKTTENSKPKHWPKARSPLPK